MVLSEELLELVSSLSQAEKRMVKLMGMARAGEAGSQQMELWEWMRLHPNQSEVPEDAAFGNNLPVVTARLKAHILDTLRILHKQDDVDATLRSGLDEASLLVQRRLFAAAHRHLRRLRLQAQKTCRHAAALQGLVLEQQIVRTQGGKDAKERLLQLRQEEVTLLRRLADARELRFRLDELLALAKRQFVPRTPEALEEIRQLGDGDLVHTMIRDGGYVDRAVAIHLRALAHFLSQNPETAMHLCGDLLQEWNAQPAWQADQATLLLQVCRTFQNACMAAITDPELLAAKNALIPAFSGLNPETALYYQRMLHQNQLALALNLGNLDLVERLIPEIEAWLSRKENKSQQGHQLSFYHNFAVAHFLAGHQAAAHRQVVRILQHPERKLRQDVRDFARVLQAVIQFELGDTQLSDYLARSAKRHFGQRGLQAQFEMAVLKHLQALMDLADPSTLRQERQRFINALDAIAEEQSGEVPLPGLMETRLWAEARLKGLPIRQVFLETVRANLGR